MCLWLQPLHMTQPYCLTSLAARLSSMGISHHRVLLRIPSVHLSAVNSSPCPGIAPQSLNSSSQPLCHLGYVWQWQGLSDSHFISFQSVQLLSRVRIFATPWTATRQASLSITNYQSLFTLMSTESVMPSHHLIFSPW